MSDNANLLKLVGNPEDETQYFLATSKGVFRSARDDDGKRAGRTTRTACAVASTSTDIVINFDNVSKPTLYIATRGRGFWRRTIE